MPTLSRRAALLQITLSVLWILGSSCSRPIPTPTPTATSIFRSEQFHLEVTLPPGWSAAEGPEYLARPFTGLVAFNSWGQAGFWAPEITAGNSSTYSPESVLSQIPSGGAYIVLVHLSGGPPVLPEQYGPEYERDDLSDLWKDRDCRESGVRPAGFFKWGRYLTLEVYCKPDISDATAEAVTSLLASWRFDHVPVGDVGWAVVEARALLPPSVEPAKFPILIARSQSEGPTQSSVQEGTVVRTTETQVEEDTAGVKLTYCWGESPLRADTTPTEQCHWWHYEAGSSGEVVLVEEGGAALPGH